MAQILHIARPPKKSRFFTLAKSRDRWPQEPHVTTGTPSLGLRSVVERNKYVTDVLPHFDVICQLIDNYNANK